MGLNCTGPFIHGLKKIQTAILHNPRLVEYAAMKLQIQGLNTKSYSDF